MTNKKTNIWITIQNIIFIAISFLLGGLIFNIESDGTKYIAGKYYTLYGNQVTDVIINNFTLIFLIVSLGIATINIIRGIQNFKKNQKLSIWQFGFSADLVFVAIYAIIALGMTIDESYLAIETNLGKIYGIIPIILVVADLIYSIIKKKKSKL